MAIALWSMIGTLTIVVMYLATKLYDLEDKLSGLHGAMVEAFQELQRELHRARTEVKELSKKDGKQT